MFSMLPYRRLQRADYGSNAAISANLAGYVRNATANAQTVTPLYSVATPWIWYQGEANREVAREYYEIRERFGVIKNYPPAHNTELREEAVEFFKVKFGVKHLGRLVSIHCVTSTCKTDEPDR